MLAQPVVMLQGNHQPVMNAIWPAAVQAAGHAGLWAAEHAVLWAAEHAVLWAAEHAVLWAAEHAVLWAAEHAVLQTAHWPGLLSVRHPAFCWQAQAAQTPWAASSSWGHVLAGATVGGLQATLNQYSACLAASSPCI